ncbi:MAG: hypothetical protein PHE60_11470 [Sulfurospirillaceae bacterium]|nr:hypothetical protein [Sulfurospirillaceae bacterium]
MLENMIEEFKRSPIAVISGVIAIIIGALSLAFAAAQFSTNSIISVPSHNLSMNSQDSVNVGNLLLIISFFLSSAFAGATMIRVIARKHDFSAFFLSIPLTALINFLTILVIYLAPPRKISFELFSSANDLVFYSSIVVFLTICGKAVLKNIVISQYEKKIITKNEQKEKITNINKEESMNTILGILFITAIILTIWSSVVFKGQSLLIHTFLPSVTYSVEQQENSK